MLITSRTLASLWSLICIIQLSQGVLAREVELPLEYVGYIRVPQIPWDQNVYEARRHFGYSPGVFVFVPDDNGFLLQGHRMGQQFAQISNPEPGRRAELTHGFADLTASGLAEQIRQSGGGIEIHSLLYHNKRLYMSAEKWYNVDNALINTHATALADLDDPQFSGWWRIGDLSGQRTGYYMCRMPVSFAGEKWLLSGGSVSWRQASSHGPAAVLVDPDGARAGDKLPYRELLGYTADLEKERDIDFRNPDDRGVSRYPGAVEGWMGNCYIGGCAVLGDKLVYFGRQGMGYDFYGTSEDYEALTGLKDPYDGKGYKCGPYRAQMWVYSLADLAAGRRNVQLVEFPWALSPHGHAALAGACVDGDMLYVSESYAEWYGQEPLPVIHVLRVKGSAGDATISGGDEK